MDCAYHNGVVAASYCQNCGKPLCSACVSAGVERQSPGGSILCEACFTARQHFQQPFAQQPFVGVPPRGPSPAVAAVLGMLFPGAGAMYNGQFFKGLIHVVIFAVLVSASHVFGIFGLFVAAWVFYQSFEAFHTAKAMRDGDPLPDPLGLNEAGEWLNPGRRQPNPAPPAAGPAAEQEPATATAPNAGQYSSPCQPGPWQTPPQGPFPPHARWRHKEPIVAIILIVLGILFLLGQIFSFQIFEFAWPVLLIALGVWLVVRRIGGSK